MSKKIGKISVAKGAGISPALYCDVTNGKRDMTKRTAKKLAEYGGVQGDDWVMFFTMAHNKIHPTMISLLNRQ